LQIFKGAGFSPSDREFGGSNRMDAKSWIFEERKTTPKEGVFKE
jgi:hypothetical protein